MKKTAIVLGLSIFGVAAMIAQAARSGPQGAAGSKVAAIPGPDINPENIRAHVKFLASDLLEGRGTGQRGGDIAAEYIATQFSLYGLKPAGDSHTFFQDVPMMGVKTLPETTFKFTEAGGKSFEAKN